jgi:hypothetical protein
MDLGECDRKKGYASNVLLGLDWLYESFLDFGSHKLIFSIYN